ncbi:MAG: chemotaxis protein CheR [Proteobacteria bacterium]|nr:chemotaxis protein CheR [Pseudomonadota bacterium]MBU1737248.1 chemotaxis protein CheR [Pseudomonadota bacterium]
MNDRLFARFQAVIMDKLGIKITSAKKTMLQSRLSKRLRLRGLKSYEEYFDLLFKSPAGRDEIQAFIDVITTNKTDFFREPHHFDYLARNAFPQIVGGGRSLDLHRGINLWSAGCSSGEEPYTIAMVANEFFRLRQNLRYTIYASDICSTVLRKARTAVYPHHTAAPIPVDLKKKYLLRSKDRNNDQVRIIPELRAKIRFLQLNFMDDEYRLPTKVQVIFCRNVMIYFDQETQKKVLARMCRELLPGGYLFVGHSETLTGLGLPLVSVGPTIYRKIT